MICIYNKKSTLTQWQTHWEYSLHSICTDIPRLTEKDNNALKSKSQVQSYVILGNDWPLTIWTHIYITGSGGHMYTVTRSGQEHTVVGELVGLP